MTLVSFSQNQEDIILWKALHRVKQGFYIDVGANDPTDDSVTKLFYEHGWNGINVEPDRKYFAKLISERPRDYNLSCAAGSKNGTIVFYDAGTRGWSTSDAIVGRQYVTRNAATEREVEQLTLDTIIEGQNPEQIHFLKIDVEGAEAVVLQGINLDKHRPWVIIVESLDPITKENRAQEWESRLRAHRYTRVFFDGLNNYYLAQEHAELTSAFSSPPNVLDGFVLNAQVEADRRATEAEAHAAEADRRATEAEAHAASDKLQMEALLNSMSWRVTAPLRWLTSKQRFIISMRPQQAVKRSVKVLLKRSARFVKHHPKLKALIIRFLDCVPKLKRGLHMMLLRAESTTVRASSLRPSSRLISTFTKVPTSVFRKRQRILNASLGTLYYYVDHTVLCPTNTGMQRVSRQLGRVLLELDEPLVFVKWHADLERLVLVTQAELEHLSLWGGPCLTADDAAVIGYPSSKDNHIVIEGDDIHDRNWLIVPEVSHINYHGQQLTLDVIQAAKRACLRTAFVFYDAIPLRRPELASMAPYHENYMRQLLQADLIVPISAWSAQDLRHFLGAHEGVTQTYLPRILPLLLPAEVRDVPRVANGGAVKNVEESRKILCVGSIDERKNQIALVREFVDLIHSGQANGWRLELIGNLNQALSADLHSLMKACPSVVWLGHCSESELQQAYTDCAFTVFPSIEEGFGLPVAESLWHGKPCLCANFGPMAEIALEGGCLSVDMRDSEAMRKGLLSLVTDASLRGDLAQQAQHRKLTTWADYGSDFRRLLQDASSPITALEAVYYLVDHTVSYPNNTGIQRVVRGLAAALIRQGVRVIPAKWNQDKTALLPPTALELQHLAKWNGPSVDGWAQWREPLERSHDWVVFPELTSHYLPTEYAQIRDFLDVRAMRGCWVFYDSIPWKLRDIYSDEAVEGHRNYMAGLNLFELVLPISHYSRDQLELFYLGESGATTGLPRRLIACSLPGEFLETERVLEPKALHDQQLQILSVGTLEPRKNHLTLVRSFLRAASASSRPMRLTLAGGGPFLEIANQVTDLILKHPDKLRWVQSPTDESLNKLYAESDFTVYPSYEEGFGLPILESLWHARPCICMNQGAMAEVAGGGGCLQVDTCNEAEVAKAISRLAQDDSLRQRLAAEAVQRPFRTWDDYANDFALLMAQERWLPVNNISLQTTEIGHGAIYSIMPNIKQRPLLSICVSTYNRARWLALSLDVLVREAEGLAGKVELLVCDNTSIDETPDVVKPYVHQGVVRYHRNSKNVGMLGNLRVTAQEACGRYVWILGDDDVLKPGAVQKVVDVLEKHPELALVYLNYASTQDETPKEVSKLNKFYAGAAPVVPSGPDQAGAVKDVAVMNENFFTAIYCLVFQRPHALMAYSQFTEGEPFSSLPTCVPTTQHVLNCMMELPAYWVGSPQLVINMNVSWLRYAWRWILERFPETHDLAVKYGADASKVDEWRDNYMPHTEHYLNEVFMEMDEDIVGSNFDFATLVSRIKHTREYNNHRPAFIKIYSEAFRRGHPLAQRHSDSIFINN